MIEDKIKVDYNLKHKICYLDICFGRYNPKLLYFVLEEQIKMKERLTQEEFEKFKVLLKNKQTTVKNLKENKW